MSDPAAIGPAMLPRRDPSSLPSLPSHLPRPPHLPQHPASGMGGTSPIPSIASPAVYHTGQYLDDRSRLGIAASAPSAHIAHPLPYRSISHNPSPSLPPSNPAPMARSWTLDAPPHLDSQGPTHLSLPLTSSPLHHPPLLRSNSGSSAYASSPAMSPVYSSGSMPSAGSKRRETQDYADFKPKRPGMKSRKSGPPKAKLGGPGGKTFEEMLAAGEVRDRRPSGSPVREDGGNNAVEAPSAEARGSSGTSESVISKVDAATAPESAKDTSSASDGGAVARGNGQVAVSIGIEKVTAGEDHKVMWKGKEVVVQVPRPSEQSEMPPASTVTARPTSSPSLHSPAVTDWNDDAAFGEEADPWTAPSGTSTTIRPPLPAQPSDTAPAAAPDPKPPKRNNDSKRGKELLGQSTDDKNSWEAPTEGSVFGFSRPSPSPDTPAVSEKKAGKRKKKRGKEDVERQDTPMPGADLKPSNDENPWEAPASSDRQTVQPVKLKIKGIAGLPPKPTFLGRESIVPGSKQPDTSSTAGATTTPASNSAPSDSVSPSSPSTSLRSTIDSPTRRTFSAAGMGGNAFLRKSLGGMLKEAGTVRKRSGSARASDAASSAPFDQLVHKTASSPAAETESQPTAETAQAPDGKSTEFVDEPLSTGSQAGTEPEPDALPMDAIERDSPQKTITPARSRTLAPLLQAQQAQRDTAIEPMHANAEKAVRSEEKPSETTAPDDGADSPAVDLEGTISAAKRLRPMAPVFVPPGIGVSQASAATPSRPSLPPVELSETLHESDQSQKRARLRPTASAFVPRPTGSIRRKPLARPDQPGADNEQRIAPDSFSFAPQLAGSITSMRPNPNAPAFVPSARSMPFVPRPPQPAATFARHPNGAPHGQFTFASPGAPHFNPAFFRPSMAGPTMRPTGPAGASGPHNTSAFMQRGTMPMFTPPGYGQIRPVNTRSNGATSSHGSIDVADLFYQRPMSSIESEQLHAAHRRGEPVSTPIDGSHDEQVTAPPAPTPTRPREASPDVPQSAHTLGGSPPDSSAPLSSRPLSPVTSDGGLERKAAGRDQADQTPTISEANFSAFTFGPGALTSTPVRLRDGQASTDGTFTTADGSPLLPRRLTPAPSPYRTTIPLALPSMAAATPRGGLPVSPRPVPESPKIDSANSDRTAGRSLSFPRPEIKVDPAADDKRFREWTFPAGRDGSVDRPSISRRHTMPVRDIEPDSPLLGVASTLAGRVQEFRDLLSHGPTKEGDLTHDGIAEDEEEELAEEDGRERRTRMRRDMSTQSSVEFPMREEKKALKVVNATPTGTLSPGLAHREDRRAMLGAVVGAPIVESPGIIDGAEKMGEVLVVLHRLELGLQAVRDRPVGAEIFAGIREELAATRQAIAASREETQSALETLSHGVAIEQIADALEQQASALATIRDAAGVHRDDDNHGRTKEMYEAMLVGQHAILNKIAEAFENKASTAESLTRIGAVLDEMAERLLIVQTGQRDVESLRDELEIANGRLIQAQTEKEGFEVQMKSLKQDAALTRVELDKVKSELGLVKEREAAVKEQLDTSEAARTAAERERDALSEALRAGLVDIERLNAEVSEMRKELATEREKAEKERDGAATLAEIATTAVAFHEEVLSRMTRLDEGMFESMESRVKEYERVLDRKNNLEQELAPLRARYEAVLQENTEVRLAQQDATAKHDSIVAALRHKLELAEQARQTDAQRREETDRRVEEMQRQMDKLRSERESARLMANERASWAKMNEVRLQSLSQEAVYWRQFALETDRHKYRTYIGSNPFQNGSAAASHRAQDQAAVSTDMAQSGSHNSHDSHDLHGSPPDTQLKTPADVLRNGSRSATMQTPTKGNGEVQPLTDSDSNGSIAHAEGTGERKGQVYEQVIDGLRGTKTDGEEGTWWTVT